MLQRILGSALPPVTPDALQQLILGGQSPSLALPSLLPAPPPARDALSMLVFLTKALDAQASGSLSSFETLLEPSAAPTSPPSTEMSGSLVIAQIDQFSTDASGFNHGEAVARELTDSDDVALLKFDVSGGNTTQGIANSLESIIQKVKNGERIDAVNISQQDFSNSADAQRVREAIDALQALGVPVAVAAGNNGANAENQLASENAFIVESSDKATSGTGNVSAQGRTTSFATANLAPVLARLRAQGLGIDEIRQQLS